MKFQLKNIFDVWNNRGDNGERFFRRSLHNGRIGEPILYKLFSSRQNGDSTDAHDHSQDWRKCSLRSISIHPPTTLSSSWLSYPVRTSSWYRDWNGTSSREVCSKERKRSSIYFCIRLRGYSVNGIRVPRELKWSRFKVKQTVRVSVAIEPGRAL